MLAKMVGATCRPAARASTVPAYANAHTCLFNSATLRMVRKCVQRSHRPPTRYQGKLLYAELASTRSTESVLLPPLWAGRLSAWRAAATKVILI